MQEIAFTKVRLPFGWLGNMAPYPVRLGTYELLYPTTEHLFQALRFSPEDPIRDIIRKIPSPMAAKMAARQRDSAMIIRRCGSHDLNNMRLVLRLKIEQHPELAEQLRDTNDSEIIEDVTNRQRGSALFWGAARQLDGSWKGHNWLGRLWMDLREELAV